jgi:glutamine synthetase type III
MSRFSSTEAVRERALGENVFPAVEQRGWLSGHTYERLHATIEQGHALDADLADEVAEAMKGRALAKGATHFCHWFQPVTGSTAEKHDSFDQPVGDGTAIAGFSGEESSRASPTRPRSRTAASARRSRPAARLRASVASAGQDHRLGANEAPPAIMSVFLGSELEAIFAALARGEAATGAECERLGFGTRCSRACRSTAATATARARSRSPATSSSSARSAPRSRRRRPTRC